MSKNKVLVLGSIAFDYLMGFDENFINACSIDHEKGEYQSTVTANSRIQYFGGTAGNISYNLGLLNAGKVLLLGSVGKDFFSLGYQEHIKKFENIDLDVDQHEDLFTAACYIVNDIKLNQMIIFHGGALDLNKNISLKDKIKDPENYLIAINSTQGVDAMVHFANQLHELKISQIFDPGQVTPLFSKELLIDVIKKSDILIGNKYEIEKIKEKTGMNEEELVKNLNALVKTKGEEGSELYYADENGKVFKIDIPIAKPEKYEDSNGAGDGFRAGVLTGLTLNMTILDSCRLGSVIGSFVIETAGPQMQSYNMEDVRKRFLKTYDYTPQEL